MLRPEINRFGDRAILLEWPGEITLETQSMVLTWNSYLKESIGEEIEDLVPAYSSICVFLRSKADVVQLIRRIEQMEPVANDSHLQSWHYHLPVCYHKDFGPDLDMASKNLGLDPKELVQLHSSAVYRVYFIGFLPGFPYLGGLDRRLWLARRSTPRPLVPKGAVGIGGQQTGIYPSQSPGGWNLIGNCPIPLFDPNWELPALLKPGDRLSFEPVSREEYLDIVHELERSTYSITKKSIHA